MSKEIRFDLALKSVDVVLTDEKTGTERKCELREMTGEQRAKNSEDMDFQFEVVDGKLAAKPGKNFKMPTPQRFLSICLFDSETQKNLTEEEISKFPQRVLTALNKMGLELSGMDELAEETAKNG